MAVIFRSLSRRDAILILLGALSMHFFSFLTPLSSSQASIVINTQAISQKHLQDHAQSDHDVLPPLGFDEHDASHPFDNVKSDNRIEIPSMSSNQGTGAYDDSSDIPPEYLSVDSAGLAQTAVVEHVPGWTIFRDIYMSNGTFLIVTSAPSTAYPEIRYMISHPIPALNTKENIAAREPTSYHIDFITPEEAKSRWGTDAPRRRVWTVEGNTLLVNDPPQFLNHYYHFCVELLLGTWAMWTGAQTTPSAFSLPPVHRAIFPHCSGAQWRDNPGFNAYFLRAVFPSLTVEVDADWTDRVRATAFVSSDDEEPDGQRAWHFPLLLLADRSAAFRGKLCGGKNQRIASEALDGLIAKDKLKTGGAWWRPVRDAVWRFAGVSNAPSILSENISGKGGQVGVDLVKSARSTMVDDSVYEDTDKIVITYISRQSARRHLIAEDHDGLVEALKALVNRKNLEAQDADENDQAKEWELNVVEAEKLTKDEQVRFAARTTILLGVHGNGLSHLVLMPRTPVSAVIEIFFPGGFAHDYEWTSRALGMQHFAVWNDTYYVEKDALRVAYPEGFQGEFIPVHGPTVAKIVEDRVAGLI